MKSKIILIGYGSQGREHLETINRHSGVDLTAIIDPVKPPETLECEVYDSINEVPGNEADAVIIATPPSTYAELIPAALKKGWHILLEKPIGTSFDESLSFIDLADKNKLVLYPAVQRRYHKTYNKTPEFYEMIGPISEGLISIRILHRATNWRADDSKRGAGVLYDLGFHAVDLALYLFGDLKLCSASFFDENGAVYHGNSDYKAELLLETELKAPILIRIQRGSDSKKEVAYIRGQNGLLEVNREQILFKNSIKGTTEILRKISSDWENAMDDQLSKFLDACKNNRSSNTNLFVFEGSEAMRIIDLAYAYGKS